MPSVWHAVDTMTLDAECWSTVGTQSSSLDKARAVFVGRTEGHQRSARSASRPSSIVPPSRAPCGRLRAHRQPPRFAPGDAVTTHAYERRRHSWGPTGERLRGHRANELDRDAVSGPSQVVRITRNLTLDRTLTLPSRQTREQTSFQSNGGCRYVTPGSGTAPRRYAGARSRGGMNLGPDWYSSSKSPEMTIKD
jgi:hypothetical protein